MQQRAKGKKKKRRKVCENNRTKVKRQNWKKGRRKKEGKKRMRKKNNYPFLSILKKHYYPLPDFSRVSNNPACSVLFITYSTTTAKYKFISEGRVKNSPAFSLITAQELVFPRCVEWIKHTAWPKGREVTHQIFNVAIDVLLHARGSRSNPPPQGAELHGVGLVPCTVAALIKLR